MPLATSTTAIRCSSIVSSTTPASGLYAVNAPVSCADPSTKRNAIARPSGDQRRSETCPFTCVSWRAGPPAAGTTQTCAWPATAASERKASVCESGDQAGHRSSCARPSRAAVIRRGGSAGVERLATSTAPFFNAPLAFSSFRTHATLFPSGETAVASNSRTRWSVDRTDSTGGRRTGPAIAGTAQTEIAKAVASFFTG